MAFETFTMNPPKRRKTRTSKPKLSGGSRRALKSILKSFKKSAPYRSGMSMIISGGGVRMKRRRSKKAWSSSLRSKFRRARSGFRTNAAFDIFDSGTGIPGAQIFGAPSKTGKSIKYTTTTLGGVAIGSKRVRTTKAKKAGRKAGKKAAGKRKSAKRYGGTRRTSRKGTTKMAKRHGWKGSRRAHQIAWALGRAGKRRGKSRFSFLRKYGATKKRIAGYRRRHRMSRGRRLSGRAFSFMYKGKRIAANKRRRSYANNRGLSTWQKLVKAHGVKGAKRLYRGKRRSRRRSYRNNRETYQIGPVAANKGRRRSRRRSYANNRELYQISPSFSTNPTTAIPAFAKKVFSVPFLMTNVVPLAAGAIGSDIIAGLITKKLLKNYPKMCDKKWKEAAWVAGSAAIGGLAIGMATKGKKADWAYKFAAGGMMVALIKLYEAYVSGGVRETLGIKGLSDYSGMGYGSDDLKRRIAEELKTELDGVGGFITQEDMDRGISASGGSVSGFVTAEDLPGEGSSISMDDFAATVAM